MVAGSAAGLAGWVLANPTVGIAAAALALSVTIALFVMPSSELDRASEKAPKTPETPAPSVASAQEVKPPVSVAPAVEPDEVHGSAAQSPQVPEPADGPESADPTVAPLFEIRAPQRLDCAAVLQAVMENARQIGPAGAAHLWLEDASTETLRLVAATGPLLPPQEPEAIQGTVLGDAISRGAALLEPLSRFHDANDDTTVWRYAVPLIAGEARGVAGIDFASPAPPDLVNLNRIAAVMRGPLAGCLALHLARQQNDAAEVLLEMARELSRLLDPEEVVQSALSKAMELSEAVTGSIMLMDASSGTMRIAAARGLPREVVDGTTVSEGEGIAGWVLASRQPLLVEDLKGKGGHARRHGVRSAVTVPIADEDGILGVLNVGSRSFPPRVSATHMNALEVLARQTAAALRNARAVTAARDLYFATLKALALALETKDPYSNGATERVLHYSSEAGRRMALEPAEQQALEIASLLHDIGMTAAGESLAVADRPLSTVERGILKMHPVLAAEILEQAPALRGVIPIVYHHHEWYDGQGYVGGLAGEAIPLGARVLAVADAFVAMTSPRPYRRAKTRREAIDELQSKAGTQFDPDVVSVFRDILVAEGPKRQTSDLRG